MTIECISYPCPSLRSLISILFHSIPFHFLFMFSLSLFFSLFFLFLRHVHWCEHAFFLLPFFSLFSLFSLIIRFRRVRSDKTSQRPDDAEDDESVLIPARCSNDGYRVSRRRPHTKPLVTSTTYTYRLSLSLSFVSLSVSLFFPTRNS